MKKIQFSNSLVKVSLIGLLVLLFLIPISLIKNLVSDRKIYQREAVSSITEPLGGKTEIQGLVIAVPCIQENEVFEKDGKSRIEKKTRYIVFAPDTYNLDFSVEPYYLTRGIFKVPVFNGRIDVKAVFSDFDYSYFNIEERNVLKEKSVLILGVSNTKNLTSRPKLVLNGKTLSISPIKYDSISPFVHSVFYNLPGINLEEKLNLSGSIDFQGGESIKIRPLGGENTFRMSSEWKSPSFSGGWLPCDRELSEKGFNARWEIAGLSTVYPKAWFSESDFMPDSVEVSFLVPVDSYKKTERSVKYALLFLMIPFIALLVSEIFSGLKIHPIQYGLIGLADVIFYLLLLSISEHIKFDLAYMLCSVLVSLATLFYASAIFKSIKWGGLLTSVQLVSYIFLYGTLQAQDYALLIGSLGLFAVVVILMFITRKIDWYSLSAKSSEEFKNKNDN